MAVAASATAPAGAAGWTPLGVFGGEVRALAIDPVHPTILYAGTLGVWKTTDGGAHWTLASAGGLEDRTVLALAIDPSAPDTLLAGTESDGVFRSTDGATTWALANQGFPGNAALTVRALAFDPETSGTAYAGTIEGVFKTTNAGASWAPVNKGLGGGSVREVLALAVDPNYPLAVYAILEDTGLFYTTNGGANWKKATAGLPADLDAAFVGVAPAGAGSSESHVVVAEGRSFWSAKVKNPKALAAFKKLPSAVPLGERAPAAEYITGMNIFLATIIFGSPYRGYGAGGLEATAPQLQVFAAAEDGVFLTQDSGKTWTGLDKGLGNPETWSLAYDDSSPPILYAGTDGGGVFRNPSGKPPWKAVNTGLRAVDVRDLAVAAGSGAVLYAATYGNGVLKSLNAGTTWKTQQGGFPSGEFVDAVATHPTLPSVVYAGTISSQVWKSVDGGKKWKSASGGIVAPCVFDLAIDPSAPDTLYAGSCGGGVYKTTNGGAQWTAVNTGLVSSHILSLALAPSAPQTIYAATHNAGVYKSTNGGATWSAANGSPGLSQFASVSGLWVHPTNPNQALASVSLGVFRTVNGGATWTQVTGLTHSSGYPEAIVSDFASDPTAPDTVYAAAEVQFGTPEFWGVFKSTNGGASWTALSTAGLDTERPLAVLVDPKAPATLYLGTRGRGAFRFTP